MCACSKSSAEKPSEAQPPEEKPSEAQPPEEKPGVSSVPSDSAGDTKQDDSVGKEDATPAVVKKTKPMTPCKDGGNYQDDSCICGKMTHSPDVASQWVCFGDFWRCLRPEGCALQGVTYPTFTEIHPDGAYCGKDRIPEKMDGFVCTGDVDIERYILFANFVISGTNVKNGVWQFTKPVSTSGLDLTPRREYWQCAQSECDCHGLKLAKSDICMDTSARAMMSFHSSYPMAYKVYDTKYDDCNGMIYPAKSERFTYDCNGGRWVCLGKDCECPEK